MSESLLPRNATTLELAIEGAQARIGDVPTPLRSLWDPETCPVDLLPWLAWALSIDNWSAEWPEDVKRARLASAIEIQRRKGTAKSVRDVVRSYGGTLSLREWWQTTPRGIPHTFSLIISAGRAELVDDIIADVTRTKPLRSHFTFTQAVEFGGAIGVAAAARPAIFARLSASA